MKLPNRADMNIKVAAFTVSEKSFNISDAGKHENNCSKSNDDQNKKQC